MTEQRKTGPGWVARMREQRRAERERRGDSPEKTAARHTPPPDTIDTILRIGGVERESRFKR